MVCSFGNSVFFRRKNNIHLAEPINIAAAFFYPESRPLRTKQTGERQLRNPSPNLSTHFLLSSPLVTCSCFFFFFVIVIHFLISLLGSDLDRIDPPNEGCERITAPRGASYHRMDGGEPQKDYYKVLEVDYDATDEAIKLNYRKLALKWHPDKHKGNSDVTAKFQEINEAYKVLSDPAKRLDYDISGTYEVNRYSLREYLTRFKGMILTCNGLGINHASSWRDRTVDRRRTK